MEMFMRETSKMTRGQGMEHIYGMMETDMKDNGKMANAMDLEI